MSRYAAADWIALVLLATLAGCSQRPTRVNPPAIDAKLAAQQAMTDYDSNSDGTIDGAELDNVPAIKNSLKELDKNADGKVSADEIRERIEQWQATKVAIMPFVCTVTLDRAPLAGATVTLVPEKFLGPNVQPASGISGDQGNATVSMPKEKMPNPNFSGVNVGFYRVEISKEVGGKEIVPGRYNVNTEIGQEVAPGVPALQQGMSFALKSR